MLTFFLGKKAILQECREFLALHQGVEGMFVGRTAIQGGNSESNFWIGYLFCGCPRINFVDCNGRARGFGWLRGLKEFRCMPSWPCKANMRGVRLLMVGGPSPINGLTPFALKAAEENCC